MHCFVNKDVITPQKSLFSIEYVSKAELEDVSVGCRNFFCALMTIFQGYLDVYHTFNFRAYVIKTFLYLFQLKK